MIRRHTQNGFTLIELMVSIGLMLLIMVGINIVFTTTSATVGTNTAIGNTSRDARATHSVLQQDLSSLAADAPAIILRGQQIWAHNNRADWLGDPTNTNPASADFTASGTETTLSAAIYNARSHRADRLSFFTRKQQRRQTGNDGVFQANQSAMEQWVWWGHATLPNNDLSAWFAPGDGTPDTNVNNHFAQSWDLARVAIMLVEPSAGNIFDSSATPVSQRYYGANGGGTRPLSNNAVATDGANFYSSRYDLAGTSISSFSTILTALVGGNWYDEMMSGPESPASGQNPDRRFRAVPFPTRPLTSQGAAQVAPIIAPDCSQFAVEFAGDFVRQDAAGNVTSAYFDPGTGLVKADGSGQDGEVDFVLLNAGTANERRVIRWYGMPRSTTGNASITAANGDTAPMRDTVRQAAGYTTAAVPIERPSIGNADGHINLLNLASGGNYATLMTSTANPPPKHYYTTAWGPGDSVRPKLIRVIFTLNDPNGRLPEGQSFEYVFTLP